MYVYWHFGVAVLGKLLRGFVYSILVNETDLACLCEDMHRGRQKASQRANTLLLDWVDKYTVAPNIEPQRAVRFMWEDRHHQ